MARDASFDWQNRAMSIWKEFEDQAPELAAFGAHRLTTVTGYLATIRDDGSPRVHPVVPVVGGGRLFVFMEPTSPKSRDIVDRGWYALHNGVPDMSGTGGEFYVSGRGRLVDDEAVRRIAVESATYSPLERYVLFELSVNEARCHGYGDTELPEPRRWSSERTDP